MSGLVGMSDYLTLKRPILWGSVSAFSVTLSGKVALRFKRISRKSFWRAPRGRPRALTNVLRPLPTCFAHVEKLGNMVSLHGKNSRRKCATQSACAVEIHEIRAQPRTISLSANSRGLMAADRLRRILQLRRGDCNCRR